MSNSKRSFTGATCKQFLQAPLADAVVAQNATTGLMDRNHLAASAAQDERITALSKGKMLKEDTGD